MIVPFYVYSASTGALLPGVLCSFALYNRRNADGTITDLADPLIADKGNGLYEFTIADVDMTAGSVINYVIDGTTAASPRYAQGNVSSDDETTDNQLVVGTGVQTFGVTPTTIKEDFFPNFTGLFSATSTPTSAAVTRWIKRAAADLSGKLTLKGLSAVTLAATSNVDAYEWCAETISLATAVRVAQVATGMNPDYAKGLLERLNARYELLEKHGAAALGSGATEPDSTNEPEGPSSHIDDLDLDTGEGDGVTSDVAPVIRRADLL